ncbi:glycosyltransferase [Vibrio tapetis]|uniref:Glycosyltransferase SypP n=1 Tax=Vibrio tapetis subsp. tapetis TaxID=1671868 RepID=A0A2N8ZMF6_9VIBR|nr:glycosyltransferase [Vibrio tapetis]SON53114.1 Glycosyltransferase SypP [Vibrio tapetis subsp. tapetis]
MTVFSDVKNTEVALTLGNQSTAKTIVHVVQKLAPGGLETLTLDLANHAQPQDHVIIVSLEGNKEQALQDWPRLESHADQLVFLNKAAGVQVNLLKELIKLFNLVKPHVVHTHHIGPLVYASIAAKISGVPHRIHTEHDAWHLKNAKAVRLEKWALKIATPTLVADAARVKAHLDSCFGYANTVTIKNGIDCAKFLPNSLPLARMHYGFPMDKTIIGSAGRLEHVKGHDLLISAMRFLPANIMLVIAGDGSKKEALQNLVKKLELEERVKFVGLVDDMARFYQTLNIFCLPSRHEGFPLSPLEAQSCGVPTAVTQVGAAEETLCPYSGRLMSPNNPINMASVVLEMLENPSQKSPRDFVLENNDVNKMAQAYLDLTTGVVA